MSAVVPQPVSLVRAVLHLCSVDLSRFRWLVSGVFGIELVRTLVVEGSLHVAPPMVRPEFGPAGAELVVQLLDLAIVLITAIATAILVQADHPTDDRAFWRTRPIPPLAVAGAKLLSMALLFVVVPAAFNAARLVAYGAPVGAIGAATTQIAVLAGVVCVPAWFLAVVTRTLPRFLGAMLGVVVVGYFMLGTLMMLLGVMTSPRRIGLGAVPFMFDWQHTELHGWRGGAISTVIGLTIVAAHYQVRRLNATVAGLLLLVLIPSLIPPIDAEPPAPADLARRVDGQLIAPDLLASTSYSGGLNGTTTARIDGRISSPPLPADVSATIRVDRIRVRAAGRDVPADGEEQCCIGAGSIAVVVAVDPRTPEKNQPMQSGNSALFRVPASAVDTLRTGGIDVDGETTVTFSRHRLTGTLPLRPGASLRSDSWILEVLAVEPVGTAYTQVLVRFARFPSMAASGARLDLFKTDPARRAARLVRAPWPIATYNPGTTVDNWSRGRTWVGRMTFTIDQREPLPPAAILAVVETTDIGTLRTRLAARDLPIAAPSRPSWIH